MPMTTHPTNPDGTASVLERSRWRDPHTNGTSHEKKYVDRSGANPASQPPSRASLPCNGDDDRPARRTHSTGQGWPEPSARRPGGGEGGGGGGYGFASRGGGGGEGEVEQGWTGAVRAQGSAPQRASWLVRSSTIRPRQPRSATDRPCPRLDHTARRPASRGRQPTKTGRGKLRRPARPAHSAHGGSNTQICSLPIVSPSHEPAGSSSTSTCTVGLQTQRLRRCRTGVTISETSCIPASTSPVLRAGPPRSQACAPATARRRGDRVPGAPAARR